MKIENTGKILKGSQAAVTVNDKFCDGSAEVLFKGHMSDLSASRQQSYIEDLQKRIFSQGDVLKKKADIYEFMQYRKLISELVGQAAGNTYTCTRTEDFGRTGKHKIFVLIKKVNNRLDEMAQEIIKQESGNIKLLKMVDDVRGLLVDMFL